MKTNILILIIAILIFIAYLDFKHFSDAEIETKIDTITKRDTVKVIQKYYSKTYVTLPKEIDTIEVIKEHFAKVERKDTLVNDSNLFFKLNQTLQKNDVISQDFEYKVYPKKTIIKPPKFYVGAFAIIQNKSVVGVNLIYRNKNIYYSLGYGNGNTFYVSVLVPLKFKK